jgi:hypothetical protein
MNGPGNPRLARARLTDDEHGQASLACQADLLNDRSQGSHPTGNGLNGKTSPKSLAERGQLLRERWELLAALRRMGLDAAQDEK